MRLRVKLQLMIVDAHLDLAWNALDHGRDLLLPLEELRARAGTSTPMVTLPALREGGVGLVFATLYVDPKSYPTPSEAHRAALAQLELYLAWEDSGWVRIVRNSDDLEAQRQSFAQDGVTGIVILMEGAEPVQTPEEVSTWARRGVRILGPAWHRTRYAGGTGEPGGLTPLGYELVVAMGEAGIALDTAHLAEEAFFQALEAYPGPVLASHANARTLTPTDRHLSDEMLKALRSRHGVVGIVLANFFLLKPYDSSTGRLPLSAVRNQIDHLVAIMDPEHVGIGSDFDGGFGLEDVPTGIDCPADLVKIAQDLPDSSAQGLLGENWLRWLASWI